MRLTEQVDEVLVGEALDVEAFLTEEGDEPLLDLGPECAFGLCEVLRALFCEVREVFVDCLSAVGEVVADVSSFFVFEGLSVAVSLVLWVVVEETVDAGAELVGGCVVYVVEEGVVVFAEHLSEPVVCCSFVECLEVDVVPVFASVDVDDDAWLSSSFWEEDVCVGAASLVDGVAVCYSLCVYGVVGVGEDDWQSEVGCCSLCVVELPGLVERRCLAVGLGYFVGGLRLALCFLCCLLCLESFCLCCFGASLLGCYALGVVCGFLSSGSCLVCLDASLVVSVGLVAEVVEVALEVWAVGVEVLSVGVPAAAVRPDGPSVAHVERLGNRLPVHNLLVVPVAQFGDTPRLGHLRLMVDSRAVLRLHARHLKQQALVLRCLL